MDDLDGYLCYHFQVVKISMLIPDADLALIDDVAEPNRTSFMVRAALDAAARIRREREDAEIGRICAETAKRDRRVAKDFEPALEDGLE